MALGKNLKRKKLIEDEKPVSKPKTGKKKVTAKKEELIKKPAKTNKTTSKKKAETKTAPIRKKSINKPKVSAPKIEEVKQNPLVDQMQVGLPIFIAEEVHSLKKELRERYKAELESIKDKMLQFVVFQIGGESYAVDISVVKEVVPLPMLSKTPNTPDHIKGIANIRGATYTVFDLAEKFKVKGDQLARFLLVIASNDIPASLMIGSLPSTLKINGNDISGSMNIIEDATLDVSFIKGIIHHKDQLIYYLDIVQLLKNDKAIIVPDKYLKRAE